MGLWVNFDRGTAGQEQLTLVSAAWLFSQLDRVQIIDVRSAKEQEEGPGYIEGSHLLPLQDDSVFHQLQLFPQQTPIIFVCADGVTSRAVTDQAMAMGYANVSSLHGGVARWVREHRPVVDFCPLAFSEASST